MFSHLLGPRSGSLPFVVLGGLLLSLAGGAARGAGGGVATRVITRGLGGEPALTGAAGEYVSASADGRYVAFLSAATNLGHDPKGRRQVCVKDRHTGVVTVASRSPEGALADADCSLPMLSANGRCVVFLCSAVNLSSQGGAPDRIYWHDLESGDTLPIATGVISPFSQDLSPRTVALSADGRWVAFCSASAQLALGDTNQAPDVFVWDRQTRGIEWLSKNASGAPGNDASGTLGVAISADGQTVAFTSDASNLAPDDTNERTDLFLRDRSLARIERVSRNPRGTELNGPSFLPSLSGNGRRVAYVTTSAQLGPGQLQPAPALLVWDRDSEQTGVASTSYFGDLAFGSFGFSALSYDGRYLAFRSGANDLVPDDTAVFSDVFVRDLSSGAIQQVNRAHGGARSEGDYRLQGPVAISDDGSIVTFQSRAGDLVAGDDNGRADIFSRHRILNTTQRVNVAADGSPALQGANSRRPVVSADGRFVAFVSDAFNLVAGDTNGDDDVFLWDRQRDTLERVSVAANGQEAAGRSQIHDGVEIEAALSGDGGAVAFNSPARNLVADDTNFAVDLFLRDRTQGTTRRVNVNVNGVQATDGVSSGPALSADGRFVAYRSPARDLVPDDTNDKDDVFVWDRLLQMTERVSLRSDGGQSSQWIMEVAQPSLTPRLSANGRQVAWSSLAGDLVPGDTNGLVDVFVRDRLHQTTVLASVTGTGDPANGSSFDPRLSSDGQRVGFTSWADNLSLDDRSPSVTAYLRNFGGNTTERLDRTSEGAGGNGESRVHALSADGRFALLDAGAALTPDDTNGCRDLFLRDRVLGLTTRVSLGEGGGQGTQAEAYRGADMSPDARFFAFSTDARNLVGGDTDRNFEIYVRDLGGAPPSPPTNLRALATSAAGIRLDWDDTSHDEFHFVVERKTPGGAFVALGTAPANSPHYVDAQIAPDTAYVYRVFALNAGGPSTPSNEAAELSLPSLPAAPTELSATPVSDIAIQLRWIDQSTNEDGFEIQRKTTGDYETVNYRPPDFREMTDENLKPNTLYTYRVRAYNRGGSSGFSNPASGTTFAPTAGHLSVVRSVNFGKARIGSPVTRTLKLRNLDRRTGLRVTFGALNGDFFSNEMGRTVYLGPGATREVSVRFDPYRKAVQRRVWELTSSDRRAKRVRITLQGVGQLPF